MILGKYNQAKTITFDLVAPDGVDLIINATFAAGDVVIMKDEGAEANTTNLPTDEGNGYSLVLTAAEMSAARIRLYVIDATATKIWLDISFGIETYGHASAEHEFDLDSPGDWNTVVPNTIAPDNAGIANIQTRLPTTLVGGLMRSDILAISNDTVAADNLEAQYDLTGLIGDSFPSTQQQVGNLSTGSAAISVSAESSTLTTGTEVNTFADTEALDGVYHEISDVAGAMDIYYQFDVGGSGIGVDITFIGRLNGNNDSIVVEAFDWAGAVWTQIGTINGVNGTTDSQNTFNILSKHTGTGANLGKIRVRGFAASGLTTATLFLDQVFLSYSVVSQSVGYANGEVWVDTNDGVAGVESFVNGVADNSSLTFADALTIAGNVGLHQYHISSDSNITLVSALTNSHINSFGVNIALGGQDVSGSRFNGVAISGIGLSPTSEVNIENSNIGNVTLNAAHIVQCGLSGTISFGTVASNIIITDSHSRLAAGILPVIDFGVTAVNHNLTMTHYHNGLEIQNYNVVGGGTDTFHITGTGSLVIAANCDGGTINIRGIWKITDNSGGAVTIVYDDITTNIITIINNTQVPKINVAFNDLQVLMVDSVDNVTPKTGLTLTVTRSINSGAFAAATGTAAEISNGMYQFDASAADMNGAVITFKFSGAGADDTFVTVYTKP